MSDEGFDDDMDNEEGGKAPFDIKVLLLYGAWRSKHWIALCTLVGMIAGLVAAASMPNVYRSRGMMDYRPGTNEAQTLAVAAGVDGMNSSSHIPGMSDELMILDDLEIYIGVARELGPAYILGKPDPTEGDDSSNMVIRLWHGFQKTMIDMTHKGFMEGDEVSEKAIYAAAESLKARTILYVPHNTPTSIITVYHDGYSKERAQETNQVILRALKAFHTSKYGGADFRETVRENLEVLNSKIKAVDDQQQTHTKGCGYRDMEGQRSAYLDQIGADKLTVSGLKVLIKGLESRLQQTDLELEDVDPMVDAFIPPVMEISPEYKEQQQFLFTLKRRLAEKRASRGIDKNVIKGLEDSVMENQNLLASMERLEEVEPGRMEPKPNTFHSELIKRRSEIRSDLVGAASSLQELNKHVHDNNEHINRMGECRQLHQQLAAELTTLQDERVGVSKQLQASENHQALVEQGYSALQLLSDATRPRRKTGPNRVKPLGMAILAGLMLGLFLAVLRQLTDPTVRYRETVEKDLETNVLVVVPEARALRRIKPGHVKVG
ncbi:MAG: hypothetical protein JKY61_03890 [Planctomycetes bacterium]|nr:hypothetical protein [Planctomycetota bacterium]